jgi:L-asparaginase
MPPAAHCSEVLDRSVDSVGHPRDSPAPFLQLSEPLLLENQPLGRLSYSQNCRLDLNVLTRQRFVRATSDLRLSDLLELGSRLVLAVESGVDGIVVSQGTDTLEETSYALDLLTGFEVPIVVTGAMRSASTAGYDGPANLLAAVRVAASHNARGLGVLVVFNDEIHHARHLRKQHATSPSAFTSPVTGPLGWLIGGQVRLMTRPVGRFRVALTDDPPEVRVAQLRVYFDDDGRLVRAVPSLGFDGLVLAAFGAGYVPEWYKPILREVARQVPVVVTTRTDAGETPRYAFGAPGSDLADLWQDLIPAAGLDSVHATVLLRLLLMARVKPGRLRDCFEHAAYPCGSVVVSGD